MIVFPQDDIEVIQNSPTPKITPLIAVQNHPSGEVAFLGGGALAEEGGFDISNSMDDSTGQCRVSFRREGLDGSTLSPLQPAFSAPVFGDGRPFFDPGVELKIYLEIRGIVPGAGPDPIGGFEAQIFAGRIGRVPIVTGENMMDVVCRDKGAYLLNTTIQEAEQRGGALMEDVIQGIVNDWMPIPLAFQSVDTSDFFIEPYAQQEMSALEACRIIAQQRGWDMRWFNGGVGPSLRLYEPRRDAILPDRSLVPFRYTKITELELSDDDLRNWWHVYWTDAAGVIHGPVEAKDEASILLYGPRFARIYVDRAYNIRTEANAIAFAEAALADNVLPLVTHSIQLACFPEVELGDLYSCQSTAGAYSGNLFGSVVKYNHTYKNGHLDTTIGIRPRALAARRDYRRSVPPRTFITTDTALPTYYAPEGTEVLVVDSLAFP